jgi:hypothetical protein
LFCREATSGFTLKRKQWQRGQRRMIGRGPGAVLVLMRLEPCEALVQGDLDFIAEGKVRVLLGSGSAATPPETSNSESAEAANVGVFISVFFSGFTSSLMTISMGVSAGGTAFVLAIQILSSSFPLRDC